ncbi:hypothetical protein AVEN_225498-1 [Araneus ventricosus]|uniref:Fibronectin type-III domain-containing protein n=1 Tax=Araneus ventricosus TaxID=182803 RepID=A0A4Y2U315_ARAVE|nr:hypothetical protein AVEN_225498-1 [Araneus ventricosus]
MLKMDIIEGNAPVFLELEVSPFSNFQTNHLMGYKLFYRAELPEWDEIEVPDPSQSQYTLRSLSCGTRYQFHIIAYNDVGRSDPSDVVSLMTQGGFHKLGQQFHATLNQQPTTEQGNLNSNPKTYNL